MKRQIEIEDTLDEIIDSATHDVRAELENYLKDNEPDKCPDLWNDLDYSGSIHEIVDSSVPIYTKEINDLFYLYGWEFEEAFDAEGMGSKDDSGFPQGWRPAAIYCYIRQKVSEWFDDHAEDIFEEWQEAQKAKQDEEGAE